ncbi:MAG: hypothetical protein IKC56_00580 [Clostridia bacterium]|nr:hypothetical protein [Clostridia bacterium]
MAKEKASKLGKIAMILGIVAVVVALFMPAIVAKKGEGSYSGLQTVIGVTENMGMGMKMKTLTFSVLALIPFVLCIVGAVLAAKGKGVTAFVAAAIFVVAAVMFFLMPSFVQLNKELGALVIESFKANIKVGTGAIIGAVCAAGAGVCTLLGALKK